MTMTRPLDAAAAFALSDISAWAAEELAARIAALGFSATIGSSGKSCSAYVDVSINDRNVCIRISDHDAMSYNRTGDFQIELAPKHPRGFGSEIVALKSLYQVPTFIVTEEDEDGEPLMYDVSYALSENADADDAEFEGYRADISVLTAAIGSAIAFIEGTANA